MLLPFTANDLFRSLESHTHVALNFIPFSLNNYQLPIINMLSLRSLVQCTHCRSKNRSSSQKHKIIKICSSTLKMTRHSPLPWWLKLSPYYRPEIVQRYFRWSPPKKRSPHHRSPQKESQCPLSKLDACADRRWKSSAGSGEGGKWWWQLDAAVVGMEGDKRARGRMGGGLIGRWRHGGGCEKRGHVRSLSNGRHPQSARPPNLIHPFYTSPLLLPYPSQPSIPLPPSKSTLLPPPSPSFRFSYHHTPTLIPNYGYVYIGVSTYIYIHNVYMCIYI